MLGFFEANTFEHQIWHTSRVSYIFFIINIWISIEPFLIEPPMAVPAIFKMAAINYCCDAYYALPERNAEILYWNGQLVSSLDTSSRTLFVRDGGRMRVGMSTSRRTSSYVITSDCY